MDSSEHGWNDLVQPTTSRRWLFVEPVRAVLRKPLCGRWTTQHQNKVRTLWSGGSWTQERLYQKGKVSSPTCQACLAGPGTDRHRTFCCSAREEHRRVVGGRHIAHRGAAPWPGAEWLWGRGLADDPAVEYRLWELPSSDQVLVEGDYDGMVTGEVFSDGSLLYGAHPALRRGGWAFVQLAEKDGEHSGQIGGRRGLYPASASAEAESEDHALKFAVYGPLPGEQWDQCIYKSELTAILRILEVACPPLVVWTDCQAVLDGFNRGPQWAARPDTLYS